jgi:hypothetical protein
MRPTQKAATRDDNRSSGAAVARALKDKAFGTDG